MSKCTTYKWAYKYLRKTTGLDISIYDQKNYFNFGAIKPISISKLLPSGCTLNSSPLDITFI